MGYRITHYQKLDYIFCAIQYVADEYSPEFQQKTFYVQPLISSWLLQRLLTLG